MGTEKRIFTMDDFSFNDVKVGDLVDEAVVNYFMDLLPPVTMRRGCSQVGEPHSHKIDPKTGRARATYATFKYVANELWEYCGNCFAGETVERGEEIPYV